MLGKLLKYDLRAMWKQFRVIWPTVLVLGAINRFTLGLGGDHAAGAVSAWTAVIAATLFGGVCIAAVVGSVLFVLSRFYRGLLGDEGYLMHTLPVPTWQLVLSKLLCSLIVSVVNTAVGLLAFLLVVPLDWSWVFSLSVWQAVLGDILHRPDITLYLLEGLCLGLCTLAMSFSMMYLSMAAGHLFHRGRVFLSVVFFLALNTVVNVVFTLLDQAGLFLAANSHGQLWAATLSTALPAALMFLAASWILKNRLNLE